MSTSGTTSYSVTEGDILNAAADKIGISAEGQVLDGATIVILRRNLNMLMKQWTAQTDFAPGLKMWTRRRAYLFMQKSQIAYSLGPTGDEWAADSYASTTLTAGASLGAGTITVASIVGLASAQRIGILLASGSMQWTTINGAPSGVTVTLTATLTGAASSGATVYAYTSKAQRPFELVTGVMRDSAGNDTPMDVHLSVDEYEAIASKSATGTPARIYFEAQRTNAKAYLDCSPSDLTNVIRVVYLAYPEDTAATTQNMDFPAEWFKPLVGQLSMDSAPDFSRPITADLKLYRDEGLAIARRAYPDRSVVTYESDPDSYY